MSANITSILSLLLAIGTYGQTGFQTLDFIYCIQGEYILSGQHNDQKDLHSTFEVGGPTDEGYWTERVYATTGKYPALYGADFLFHDSESLRWDITYEAERQWNAGAVVNIMWHSCPPIEAASCNWNPGIISALTDQQWTELLTDGSALNTTWKSRVDQVAVYLQYLADNGVEVMWRPYHEQNQTVFWWNHTNGPDRTKQLWRMLHDYMTLDLGLSNLIWVWDVQDITGKTNYVDYDPGEDYWDIMALDIYADAYYNEEYYHNMVAAAGDKPIAIGECFTLPSVQVLANFPKYTFFMNWAYGLKYDLNDPPGATNSDDYIREVYSYPNVLTRDEMPGWGAHNSTPFFGEATVIPARIEAEDYDLGGQNVAYYDRTIGNEYGAYRSDYVDIGISSDADGAYSVGQLDSDEWLNYSIDAPQDGFYEIEMRVAAAQVAAGFHVLVDSVDVTGVVAVPNTGDWQNWTTITTPPFEMESGAHLLTVVVDQAYFNFNYFEVQSVQVTTRQELSVIDRSIFYPNPSNGLGHLTAVIGSWQVFDAFGQLVLKSDSGTERNVDLRIAGNGVYYLISSEAGVGQKIIIAD